MNMKGKSFTRVVGILAGVLTLGMIGCSDATSDSSENSGFKGKGAAYSYPSVVNPKIASTNVIVRVNGISVTRGEYDAWMSLRDIVYGLNLGLDLHKRQDKVLTYRKATRETALFDLIRREILRQEAERRGVSPSLAQIQSGEKNFMKGIRRSGESFDGFCSSLPPKVREILSRQVVSDVRDNLLLKAWATNDIFSVSDQEVSNRLEFARRYEKDVDEKNAEAKRKAAAAKAEILAGASFYSVTTNRAEIFKDQGKEWDTVELGELDEESDLFRFLASANTGDISDPIDFDDGIGIVGVVMKEIGTAPEGVVPAMQYTLVRCVFNAYEGLDEPEAFEPLRKLLLERKLATAREGLVRDLATNAKIEFPYGEKLFVQKQPKKSGGGKKAGVRKAKKKR